MLLIELEVTDGNVRPVYRSPFDVLAGAARGELVELIGIEPTGREDINSRTLVDH